MTIAKILAIIKYKITLGKRKNPKETHMLEESTVNAEPVVNVEPQENDVIESVESDNPEVTTGQQEEKHVQSKEDNAKFAEVRRTAQREAQDKLIAEMYGESHGIYTKADYDRVVREQKEAELLEQMRDTDTDPKDIYAKLKESDPDFQEFQKIKTETYTARQISELNIDLKEMGLDLEIKSVDDLAKLPNSESIVNHIQKGKTLAEAYFLANKKEIISTQAQKAQAEIMKKTEQLNGASPGALDSSGGERTNSIYAMSDKDFAKMKEDALSGRLRK